MGEKIIFKLLEGEKLGKKYLTVSFWHVASALQPKRWRYQRKSAALKSPVRRCVPNYLQDKQNIRRSKMRGSDWPERPRPGFMQPIK